MPKITNLRKHKGICALTRNSLETAIVFVPTPKPGDFPLHSLDSRMAMRAEVERIKRKPKPMVRIFEDGVLKTEYECEGMEGVGFSVSVTFGSDDGSFTTGESPEPEQAVMGTPASNQPPTQPATRGRAALPAATSPTEGSGQSIVQPNAPRFPRTRTGAAMAFLRGRGTL